MILRDAPKLPSRPTFSVMGLSFCLGGCGGTPRDSEEVGDFVCRPASSKAPEATAGRSTELTSARFLAPF
jgi:hypothetical protein